MRHVDGTARIQTINRAQSPLYYDLLKAFQARTGVPVLVNTSFNTRGEPMRNRPEQQDPADGPAWPTPTESYRPPGEGVGIRIGPYKLLQQIGEGGRK